MKMAIERKIDLHGDRKKKDCTHTLNPPSHTVHTFNENWQTKEPLISKETEEEE